VLVSAKMQMQICKNCNYAMEPKKSVEEEEENGWMVERATVW